MVISLIMLGMSLVGFFIGVYAIINPQRSDYAVRIVTISSIAIALILTSLILKIVEII